LKKIYNNETPLVSIVLPTYNHGLYICRAIDSVLNQTYKNWELIIVDNYSTDETEILVSEYKDSRIQYFKNHNHGIIAISRNFGIKKSNGDWIAFLDSDDWWKRNKLEYCMFYAIFKNADILYHDLILINKNFRKYFLRNAKSRNLTKPIFYDLLINGNAILNSSVVVKKQILQKVGLLSQSNDKFTWEDYDCWLKISQITQNFFYLKKKLGFYWLGGGNNSNPERDLINSSSICLNYINNNLTYTPAWILYSQGKAYYKKGQMIQGRKRLLQLINLNKSFSLSLKSIILIVYYQFRSYLIQLF
jgi:glycosyltransferase involved in cell wall biosynthesis